METIDVYWSFRSPFSYLATPDMVALERDYDVQVRLRVVYPIAIRAPEFFREGNENWARYVQRDWVRRAEFLGMTVGWPNPDPIVQDLATFKIAEDQPYIHRLSQLGIEADRQGKGAIFAKEVSHTLFCGVKWNEGNRLSQACTRAGLDLVQMDAAIGQSHLDEISENQEKLAKSGHWGVPTFVLKGEPFFGQDRVETLRWRMNKLGIAKR